MDRILSKKELSCFPLEALVEKKNVLFEQITDRKTPKKVLLELFTVLDVLQEKRLENKEEPLPIECIA